MVKELLAEGKTKEEIIKILMEVLHTNEITANQVYALEMDDPAGQDLIEEEEEE